MPSRIWESDHANCLSERGQNGSVENPDMPENHDIVSEGHQAEVSALAGVVAASGRLVGGATLPGGGQLPFFDK